MKNSRVIVWTCGAATILLAALCLFFCMNRKQENDRMNLNLVVGTYGSHLYRYTFNNETLEFSLCAKVAAVDPSYAIALQTEGGNQIFAVRETLDDAGACSFLENGQPDIPATAERLQTGSHPCFIMKYDNGSSFILTADYSGGSVSVFPVADGVIRNRCQQLVFEGCGPVTDRQASSHVHQVRILPGNKEYVLASDLGADMIHVLKFTGNKEPFIHTNDIKCPCGSGPRHMEFSKDGNILYCITELSGEILVYDITNEDGAPSFTLKQQVLADEIRAGGSADIHIHPSGKWIYTSHRLENDGIATFEIRNDGTLEKVGYDNTARHPRNFMITPEGNLLLAACRDDKTIQVFRINDDGTLKLTSSALNFEQDMPSSVTAF